MQAARHLRAPEPLPETVEPATARRRRRAAVAVTVAVGTAVLGATLAAPDGSPAFTLLGFLASAVWLAGSAVAGPLPADPPAGTPADEDVDARRAGHPGSGATGPAARGPGTTDPAEPGPGTTDPAEPGPGTMDPAARGPGTTDPAEPGREATGPPRGREAAPGRDATDPAAPGREATDPGTATTGAQAVALALALAVAVLAFVAFLGAALVAREVPALEGALDAVLDTADAGPLGVVLAIAAVNAVAEERFFRGALPAALAGERRAVRATAVYVLVTVATLNLALVIAAAVMGTVFMLERLATRGLLVPTLTHVTWSALMILLFPK